MKRPIKIVAHEIINAQAGGIKLKGKISHNSDIFTQSVWVAEPR
jgi:hypothetical protein